MDEKEERFSQPDLLLEEWNYCGLSRKTLSNDMYISLSVLHNIFYVSRVGSQNCKVLVADPVAQILAGLRVKQEKNTRRLLLWSQEVTFDKRWNSQTQFQGFRLEPCGIYSHGGAVLEHPEIPRVIFLHIWKMVLIKPCPCFVSSSEQILFYKALPSRLMGRGWFFLLFFLFV